jgi:hypothetical protein
MCGFDGQNLLSIWALYGLATYLKHDRSILGEFRRISAIACRIAGLP